MAENAEKLYTIKDLPKSFQVKYLGWDRTSGLWGMKHTRKPVDHLVSQAKTLPQGKILQLIDLEVSADGLSFTEIAEKRKKQTQQETTFFAISTISYGVQDLVYTRVFSIIIVEREDLSQGSPFVCHGFLCSSREEARQITFALAAAFQNYGKIAKEQAQPGPVKKFAIDLRSPEDQNEESEGETEA